MIYTLISHLLTLCLLLLVIMWSHIYYNGIYYRVVVFATTIHYVLIITQNHFLYFGSADISDYQHYFESFSSISSVADIISYFSPHVSFYTLLYPGWLYAVLDIESFIVIRTINFILLLAVAIPINHILSVVFKTYLQPWQLLIILLLPSTTRYSIMISRDMMSTFLILAFVALFLNITKEKRSLITLAFIITLLSTILIRVHNVIFLLGSFGSLVLLNLIYSENKSEKIIVATLFGLFVSIASYHIFINYGPSYHAISGVETLASVAEGRTEGQSAYLEGYYPRTVIDLIWYLPLHAFYFLFSPMPWHIHNIESLAGFVESWFILSLVIASIIVGRKIFNKNRWLILLIMIIVVFAIGFGSGVKNAGGAMRWRLPATILLFVLSTTILNIAWQTTYKDKLFH